MNPVFKQYVKSLEKKCEILRKSNSLTYEEIPKEPGIYLFTENGKYMYVGRTRNLKRRRNDHLSRHISKAPFAFKLARETTGNIKASYKSKGSREELINNPLFQNAFIEASKRIDKMKFQCIVETDSLMQTLLEIYIALVLNTPYNDFDTH